MTRKQVNLEEMFENNDFVLVDNSVFSSSNFLNRLYEANSFEYIDRQEIISEKDKIYYSIEMMKNLKMRVIPEVAMENKQYSMIMGDSLSYISRKDRNRCYKGKRKKHTPKRFVIDNESSTNNKELLEELQKNAYLLYQMCIRSKFEVTGKSFELILEMIKILDNCIGLKRDLGYGYGSHDVPDTSIDTDERVIASLYWNSLNSEERSSLLASDTDFPRLLGVTSKLMGSDEFLPYNEFFRKRLDSHPFKLYMMMGESINEETYHPINFDKVFSINKISEDENLVVQERIRSLWIEFSKN